MVLINIKGILLLLIITMLLFSCSNGKKDINASNVKLNTTKENNDSINTQKLKSERSDNGILSFEYYINSRFGFSVKYPSNLTGKNESENGDGREFFSSEGFKMTVYGSNDVSALNQTIDDIFKEELSRHKDVTYKVKKNNWFVISGYDEQFIYYIKKYVGKGSTNTLSMMYPSNLRDKYYDVVSAISKSFEAGNINNPN